MMRRQLPARRVLETITACGWDAELFSARYAALDGTVQAPDLPAAPSEAGPLLSTAQAAKRLRVDEKTVRRWVGRKLLRAWRSRSDSPYGGRYAFDAEQLAAFERERWHLLGPEPQQQGAA